MKKPRKVLITGASGGIGLAVAERFAQNGDALFLHGFSRTSRLELLRKKYPQNAIHLHSCDLSLPQEQEKWLDAAWTWKSEGWDVLILCAGVDILTGTMKTRTFEEKLDALWKVDVVAGVRIAKELTQRRENAGRKTFPGTILFLGWDAVDFGMAGDSAELFALAKGAITAFARCLAQKVSPDCRVHVLAPGWIQTDWAAQASEKWQQMAIQSSLMKRWGTPQDMAELAFFLASPEAEFLNAMVWPVNGGRKNQVSAK
ncbi:MAG: SDR family oxidoreductase [Planctomycetia bacterium]|nr:SDR family oxidoreductase [Planctomycetia bacterium]